MYRFDDFTLDTQTRRLLRGGGERHLSPKAFDLLALLIESRARAMSKTELHEKLWPATYVLETNLAGLVAEIRQALEDSASEPRYVRTVHRFGYWFVGAIQNDGAARAGMKSPIKYWLVWETRQVPLSEGTSILGRAPDAEVHYRTSDDVGAKLGRQVARFVVKHALKPE